MGTFKSSKVFFASPALMDTIVKDIELTFTGENFSVKKDELFSGGYDISLTKGKFFKAVLGMRSALKVLIQPREGNIYVEAGIGIFGQQVVPSIITMLFFWPVLIAQLWGIVKQAKLDDKVMDVIQDSITRNTISTIPGGSTQPSNEMKFCTECGTNVPSSSKFCGECGAKL